MSTGKKTEVYRGVGRLTYKRKRVVPTTAKRKGKPRNKLLG